jgi:four helix bundle protein
MTPDELKLRCKQFSLRVIRLVRVLPDDKVCRPIANQLIRSGTSVSANYRAACLAKSRADFASKMGTAAEESDESALWMELIMEDNILPKTKVAPLCQEAVELTSIFIASIKTARKNSNHQ